MDFDETLHGFFFWGSPQEGHSPNQPIFRQTNPMIPDFCRGGCSAAVGSAFKHGVRRSYARRLQSVCCRIGSAPDISWHGGFACRCRRADDEYDQHDHAQQWRQWLPLQVGVVPTHENLMGAGGGGTHPNFQKIIKNHGKIIVF